MDIKQVESKTCYGAQTHQYIRTIWAIASLLTGYTRLSDSRDVTRAGTARRPFPFIAVEHIINVNLML